MHLREDTPEVCAEFDKSRLAAALKGVHLLDSQQLTIVNVPEIETQSAWSYLFVQAAGRTAANERSNRGE
jgi:hypothetical protein